MTDTAWTVTGGGTMSDTSIYIERRRIDSPADFVGRTISLDLDGEVSSGWNLRRVTEHGCVVTKGDHAVEHLVPANTLLALNPIRNLDRSDHTEEAADTAVRLLRTLGEGRIGPRLRKRGFDQIEPDFAQASASIHSDPSGEAGIWMDARPRDIEDLPALNIAAMGDINRDGGPGDAGNDFYLWRVHKVAPRAVRGRVQTIRPFMAQVTVGQFNTRRFGEYVFGWDPVGDGRWRDLAQIKGEPDVTLEGFVKLGVGLHWNRQFQWRVLLSLHPDSPRISMTTDPVGMKEIFRLRDVPPGKKRRAALRTWISEHWRRKARQDKEASVFVKQHLRGAQIFDWNGLRCTLIPAPDELEAVKAKYEAGALS